MIECPSCHKKNERHYKFCLGCGAELPVEAIIPTPTTDGWVDSAPVVVAAEREAPQPTEPASQATARSCPSCGTLVAVNFTFCGQCGFRMESSPDTQRSASSGGISDGHLVLVRADGSEGGTHNLALGENVIGRGQGALFDADGYLSPRHAEISLGGQGAIVRDVDSLNGVFVRITAEEELADGDVFRVGQELLRFEALPPAEPLDDGTHIMGSPPGNAWGRLVLIVSRTQDGSASPLAGESVILGRERGDVLFPEDGYVSGTHARISQRNGRCYLTDLNSSNGTFLRLRAPRAVPTGTFLLLGQQLFRVAYN
jgi:pSer/pThr/pTyr-binding forkhead associated (FHA) protein